MHEIDSASQVRVIPTSRLDLSWDGCSTRPGCFAVHRRFFRSGSARCGDVRGAEVLVEPKNQDVGLEFSAGDSRSLIMGVPSIGPIPFSWVAELSLTSCPVCWTL